MKAFFFSIGIFLVIAVGIFTLRSESGFCASFGNIPIIGNDLKDLSSSSPVAFSLSRWYGTVDGKGRIDRSSLWTFALKNNITLAGHQKYTDIKTSNNANFSLPQGAPAFVGLWSLPTTRAVLEIYFMPLNGDYDAAVGELFVHVRL